MNDTFALFSLLSHPGVSPQIARQLIQLLGSAEAVLQERDKTNKAPKGVRDSLWKKLSAPNIRKKAEKDWAKIGKEKVSYVDYRQDHFPLLLNHTYDGPLLLFFRGKSFPDRIKLFPL